MQSIGIVESCGREERMASTELVSADEAAKATGLSKYFIYRLAAAGKVPAYKAGRAVRFDILELRAWMREQARQEAQP